MLSEVFQNLEEDHYKKWKKHADSILTQLKKGLDKIKDPVGETSPELTQIRLALKTLQDKKELEKKDYIDQLTIIAKNLNTLANTTEFTPLEVNNFIFQARRAVNALTSNDAVVSYVNLVDKLLTPSQDVQERTEVGFIAKKGAKFAAKQISNNLLGGFENDLTPFLRMQVDNMPEVEIKQVITLPGAPKSLLATKLDPAQEKTLKNKRPINNKNDVALSLAEQTYGTAFEATYSQIIAAYGMLAKIEHLASQEDSVEKTALVREKLLKESGFNELVTKDCEAYLDNLAKHLGFTNAKNLYENYQQLPNKESFDHLNDAKRKFMDFAHHPSPGADPLEKIKSETEKEYSRVKEKMKSSADFRKESRHYAMAVGAFTNDIIRSLDNAKRTQIIVDQIPDNAIANLGAYLGNIAVEWLGWFQGRTTSLDDYIFGGLYREASLFDRRLQEFSLPLDEKIVELNKKVAKENQERREQLLGHIEGGIDELKDEELVQNYAARMQMLEHSRILLEQVDKSKQPNEYLSREGAFKALEQEYLNYSDAFNAQFDRDIRNLSQTKLDELIERKQEKINQIEKQEKQLEFQVKARAANINDIEKKERTIGGWFTRQRDRVVGLFGYKTKTAKVRESLPQQKRELESLKQEHARLKFELSAHKNIMDKAQAQKELLIQYTSEKDLTSLAKMVKDLIDQISPAYDAIESATTPANMFKAQQAFLKIENELKIAIKPLQDQLDKSPDNTLSAEMVDELLEAVAHIKTAYETPAPEGFNRIFIDLPDGVKSSPIIDILTPLEKRLTSIYIKNASLRREETINKAKERVTNLFRGKSLQNIQDPFEFILKSQKEVFIGFSDNSKPSIDMRNEVWQHVKQVYATLIKSTAATLNKEELEKLYLNFKTTELTGQANAEFKPYYDGLAEMIASVLEEKTPNEIISLDGELQHIIKLTHEAVTNRETAQSWLWNPIGLTSVEKAKAHEAACITYFSDFSKKYSEVTPGFYQHLSHLKLTQHLENLENCAKLIDEMAKKSPENSTIKKIQDRFRILIETANKANASHIFHRIKAIHESFENIGNSMQEAKELREKIETTANTTAQFDNEDYRQYNALLGQISAKATQLQSQIENIDNQFSTLGIDDYHSNSDYIAWKENKATYLKSLNQLTGVLKDVKEKVVPSLEFYQRISQNATVEVKIPPLDKNSVSQGLVMAIEYDNIPALKAILDKKISIDEAVLSKSLLLAVRKRNEAALQNILAASKFSVSSIEAALEIAAMQGDFANMEKIYAHRKDAVLRQEVVDKCIKNAFMNIPAENADFDEPHRKIIHYLVLNSNPSTQTLREIAEGMSLKGTINLPNVTKNWIVDNDYENLTKIRNYFIFEKELLDALHEEFESLINEASKIKDNKDPNYQKNKEKMEKFYGKLNKIAEMRKNYLDYFRVENSDRRDKEYIKDKWEKEMPYTISGYREALDEQALRILNASIPKAQKTFVSSTPEIVTEETIETGIGIGSTIIRKPEPPERSVEKSSKEQVVSVSSRAIEEIVEATIVTPTEPQHTGKGKEEVEMVISQKIEEPPVSRVISSQEQEDITKESTTVPTPTQEVSPHEEITQPFVFDFKNAQAELTKLLSPYSMSTDRILSIKALLKEYRQNSTTKEQQDEFYSFISNAVNEIAKKDKETPEALWAVLSSIKDPSRKAENIRNAFFVAISHGQHNTVQFLCSKNLHKTIKGELFEHLYSVLNDNKNRIANAEVHYFQVASALLANNIIEPTMENQAKIKEILEITALARHSINNDDKKVVYTIVKGSWGEYRFFGGKDNDKPFLEDMRNLYIHSENAFYRLADEADYLNKAEVSRKIADYTPQQIKILEEKIASWEKEWKDTLAFKTNYIQMLSDKIENKKPRLEGYQNSWDKRFDKEYEQHKEKFDESIEEMRAAITEYHKQRDQRIKPVVLSSKSLSEKEKTTQDQKPTVAPGGPKRAKHT